MEHFYPNLSDQLPNLIIFVEWLEYSDWNYNQNALKYSKVQKKAFVVCVELEEILN